MGLFGGSSKVSTSQNQIDNSLAVYGSGTGVGNVGAGAVVQVTDRESVANSLAASAEANRLLSNSFADSAATIQKVAMNANQFVSDIAKTALNAQVDTSIYAIGTNAEVIENISDDIADITIANTDFVESISKGVFDTQLKSETNFVNAVKEIKTQEQLGTTTVIEKIGLYAGLTVAAIFIAKYLGKRG